MIHNCNGLADAERSRSAHRHRHSHGTGTRFLFVGAALLLPRPVAHPPMYADSACAPCRRVICKSSVPSTQGLHCLHSSWLTYAERYVEHF